ncbi:MAG: hypothetical protein HQK54_14460 [Oligoflexales bacterium]|nr:hypothetical protein [Oligoflexales bacterium]
MPSIISVYILKRQIVTVDTGIDNGYQPAVAFGLAMIGSASSVEQVFDLISTICDRAGFRYSGIWLIKFKETSSFRVRPFKLTKIRRGLKPLLIRHPVLQGRVYTEPGFPEL